MAASATRQSASRIAVAVGWALGDGLIASCQFPLSWDTGSGWPVAQLVRRDLPLTTYTRSTVRLGSIHVLARFSGCLG